MNFFESLSSNLTKAVDFVVDKNRKAAMINRLQVVIKNERENESRAYVALGKYYFEHLRDPENEETELLCRTVDFSDRRMKKAFAKLDEITAPEGCEEDSCTECGSDCDYCPYSEEPEEVQDPDIQPEEPSVAPARKEFCDENNPSVSCIVSRANENADVPSAAYADEVNEEAADDTTVPPEFL